MTSVAVKDPINACVVEVVGLFSGEKLHSRMVNIGLGRISSDHSVTQSEASIVYLPCPLAAS